MVGPLSPTLGSRLTRPALSDKLATADGLAVSPTPRASAGRRRALTRRPPIPQVRKRHSHRVGRGHFGGRWALKTPPIVGGSTCAGRVTKEALTLCRERSNGGGMTLGSNLRLAPSISTAGVAVGPELRRKAGGGPCNGGAITPYPTKGAPAICKTSH